MDWLVKSGSPTGDYVLIVPANAALEVPEVAGSVWVSQRMVGQLGWTFSFSVGIYQTVVLVTTDGRVTVTLRGWQGGDVDAAVKVNAVATAKRIAVALPDDLAGFGFRTTKENLVNALPTAV